MKINIKYNYGGAPTNERRIQPGIYDIDDPALFGVGEYLVKNGHAENVIEPEPEPEVAEPAELPKPKRGRTRKTKRLSK